MLNGAIDTDSEEYAELCLSENWPSKNIRLSFFQTRPGEWERRVRPPAGQRTSSSSQEHALSFEEFTAELTEKGLRSRQALLAWITRHKVLPTQATPPKEDKSQKAQEVRGANDTAVRLMDEAKQLRTLLTRSLSYTTELL